MIAMEITMKQNRVDRPQNAETGLSGGSGHPVVLHAKVKDFKKEHDCVRRIRYVLEMTRIQGLVILKQHVNTGEIGEHFRNAPRNVVQV